MRLTYPVELTSDPDDGGFVVTFPDFPEAITQGESLHDALYQATDCLEEVVAERLRLDEELPSPSKGAAAYWVDLPAQLITKVLLRDALRDSSLNKSKLAKLMNCSEKEVRRLLDPRHRSKLSGMERAFHALDRRLILSVEKRVGRDEATCETIANHR